GPKRTVLCVTPLLAALLWGCASHPAPTVTIQWVVGQASPGFDPQGPPDPVRWAFDRLLSRGLVEEDSTGRIVPVAAESIRVSPNGLVYSFALRHDLTFTDGRACEAADFRRALENGLSRLDHGTYAWLAGAATGMA